MSRFLEYCDTIAQMDGIAGIAAEIAKLVTEKNEKYGNSFAKTGQFMTLLYPDGIRLEQYTEVLGIVRIWDKMNRIATSKDAFGESPWKDICGYALIALVNQKNE